MLRCGNRVQQISFKILYPCNQRVSGKRKCPHCNLSFIRIDPEHGFGDRPIQRNGWQRFPFQVVNIDNITVSKRDQINAIMFFINPGFIYRTILSRSLTDSTYIGNELSLFIKQPAGMKCINRTVNENVVFGNT